MKKFLLGLLVIVVVFVVVVLVIASTKPDTYRVQYSVLINAKPDKIFANINDFHTWLNWSPWEAMDPEMTRTITGAPGKAQVYEWVGKRAGHGRMEIVESTLPGKISVKSEWLAPMKMSNMSDFTLVASGTSTQVTWTMYGPDSFLGKIMSVFMDRNKMLQKAFESGLTKLKAISEK
jgi:hypothetical protein